MTSHPFSNGLTELIPEIVSLKPGQNHPLMNRQGYCKQLQQLSANAQRTLQELKMKSGN